MALGMACLPKAGRQESDGGLCITVEKEKKKEEFPRWFTQGSFFYAGFTGIRVHGAWRYFDKYSHQAQETR